MTYIYEEKSAKRITHKDAHPKLIALSEMKDVHRISDIKILIKKNCPKKERSLLRAFRMFSV